MVPITYIILITFRTKSILSIYMYVNISPTYMHNKFVLFLTKCCISLHVKVVKYLRTSDYK